MIPIRSTVFPALVWGIAVSGTVAGSGDGASHAPPPVPRTRQEMKQALEESKHSQPRLPLPPLTEAEQKKAELGDWSVVNNSRMRRHYLPPELVSAGFLREPDPAMSLGYAFQTKLFWIVSRINNCTYCLGHQESKLSAAGLSDDQIAELDGDWSAIPEADRAAYEFTRRLSQEPHRIGQDDIDRLRRHFRDLEVLEIITSVAGFNAMNRWTGALAIPQEDHRVYLTPTAPKDRDLVSLLAPLEPAAAQPATNARSGARGTARAAQRPELEPRAEVEAALQAARTRHPRIPLVAESQAKSVVSPDWPDGPLPAWVRLLAHFPKAGQARIQLHRAAWEKGTLSPQRKAEIAWVCARNDRAWYALGLARESLHALGLSDDQIFALDHHDRNRPTADDAILRFARKLTIDPPLIQDDDIATLRAHFSDREVAEIVFHITEAAFFNRVTEACGLPLPEDGQSREGR